MKHFWLITLLILLTVSCAPSRVITESNEIVDAEESQTEVSEERFVINEPTKGWHLQGNPADQLARAFEVGISLDSAYLALESSGRVPEKTIVAIIDSGSDIDHEDLQARIWSNKDEIVGNGIDDDANGYIDDQYGWNFIGGSDSTHVNVDTYEITRLYRKGLEEFSGLDSTDLLSEEVQDSYANFKQLEESFLQERSDLESELLQIKQIQLNISSVLSLIGASSLDSVDVNSYFEQEDLSMAMQEALGFIALLQDNGITETLIDEYLEQLNTQLNYGYNIEFNPRYIVGDNYEDWENRWYGNEDVKGPDHDHGTHVAGIVGADRDNSIGIHGIADVELMIIRAVPNGDEHDKDVANAIRYAIDNGAKVINMSFGKAYSPQKFLVDEAIMYAQERDVIMIHAAGNDGKNVDVEPNYPNPNISADETSSHFVTVGASGWSGADGLAAAFSNYGLSSVDIFAPGVDIYSTMPNQTYELSNGTSMAAPVVTGVFALLMNYFPELSPLEIRDVVMQSVNKLDTLVPIPGQNENIQEVPFSSLSISGGIINAHKAVLEALNRTK